MIEVNNPWGNMGPSSQRRIVAESPHDVFWVTDSVGNYGFLIITKELTINTENKISLKGITLHKRSSNPDQNELFLILNKKEDWEIFYALCKDFVEVIVKHFEQKEMISAIEARLKRWQHLLKQPRTVFTYEQQMGLFAELMCLRDFVMVQTGSLTDAISSWGGPDFDRQDFLLNDAVIEVKSYRTSKGESVLISSAHQLCCEKQPFYLFSYALTNTENGLSIDDISGEIKQMVWNHSVELAERFEEKLLQYGFVPELINEPLQRFVVDKIKVYQIRGDFPRIVPSDLKVQITSLKYTIDLSKCNAFEVNIQSFCGGGLHND